MQQENITFTFYCLISNLAQQPVSRGDSDAPVSDRQSCSVHYREEECVPSLYKAWKPVPPRSVTVPLPHLHPHWDFRTVSLCPPHLPSLWSEGSQRFFLPLPLSSSLSLLDSGLPRLTWPPVESHCSEPAPLFFWLLDAFLGTWRKMPEPTKKGRSVVSEDESSMLPQKNDIQNKPAALHVLILFQADIAEF